MKALAQFAETTGLNRAEMAGTALGVVTSGTSYLYVKEVLPEASVFKLGLVNPLPVEVLRAFSEKIERLIVVEELDGVIETHLRSHGIRTRYLRKLSEGSTEIYDSLRKGHVTYVINTIDVNQHSTRRDGYDIRRAAVENNVTIFTALETVSVLLDVLEEITLGVSTIDAE